MSAKFFSHAFCKYIAPYSFLSNALSLSSVFHSIAYLLLAMLLALNVVFVVCFVAVEKSLTFAEC